MFTHRTMQKVLSYPSFLKNILLPWRQRLVVLINNSSGLSDGLGFWLLFQTFLVQYFFFYIKSLNSDLMWDFNGLMGNSMIERICLSDQNLSCVFLLDFRTSHNL